jgi:type I restriction enzyme S subunit
MAQTTRNQVSIQKQAQFHIVVPPLAEQHRIVAKVEELTKLCTEWRLQLERKQSLAAQLATTAVGSLTGISLSQPEDAPVKAPETELIAPLRLNGTPPPVKAQAPLATLLADHAGRTGEMLARELWQRFGGDIDAFYAQLKTEIAHGWIAEPAVAEMRERPAASPPPV